jgi:hypothetical protein
MDVYLAVLARFTGNSSIKNVLLMLAQNPLMDDLKMIEDVRA